MRKLFLPLTVLALFGGKLTATDKESETVNVKALQVRLAEPEFKMPKRIFTPEFLAAMKSGKFRSPISGHPGNGKKWLNIPDKKWQTLIRDFAAFSSKGGNLGTGGNSPFTGKYYRGCRPMTEQEFLNNPHQATTYSGHTVYEYEKDMPANYKAKPNKTVKIPHYDGSMYPYRFYIPKGLENATAKYNSKRKDWYCSAAEVWGVRLNFIMNKVIPDLAMRVVMENDDKACHILAVIIDRIAEVYPALPIYSRALGHGFARNRAGNGYLTEKDYHDIKNIFSYKLGYKRPYWFHGIYDYNYAKLNWGISGWTDGVADQTGLFAKVYDLIRDRKPTLAYSKQKYGDEKAWDKKVYKNLIKEAEYLCLVSPATLGNTMYGYLNGAPYIAIMTGNKKLFSHSLSLLEVYFANNWFADGMPTDAAFNYAMMTYGLMNYRWMFEYFAGIKLTDRFPLGKRAFELGPRPVVTLYNVESKHSDQHARFFRSRRPWMPPPEPGKIPYEKHEKTQIFPTYGMSVLRGGAPGSRLELIYDHLNTSNHAHLSRLNFQLFYEGIELLPDFGYSVGYIDPDKEPWKTIEKDYPYEFMGSPEPRDKWGPWRHAYAMGPEAHCTAMVDYYHHTGSPSYLYGYLGNDSSTKLGSWAVFSDAGAKTIFKGRPNYINTFRRQLVVLTMPNGRPIVVDIFRIRGGKKHDLFFHVANEMTSSSLGKGKKLSAPNLQKYLGVRPNYDKLTGKVIQHYGRGGALITGLESHPVPDKVFTMDFDIKPSKLLPKNPKTLAQYGDWPKLLHDVHLKVWSDISGSKTEKQEIISAKGPWSGILEEIDPKTGRIMQGLKIVGMKDAISYIISSRTASQPGLISTFFNVLEPFNPSQKNFIQAVKVLNVKNEKNKSGLLCEIQSAAGNVLLGTTLKGREYNNAKLNMKATLGIAFEKSPQALIYDGSYLKTANIEIQSQPSWNMQLERVIGDLTGTPTESALIVSSDTPLPLGEIYTGRLIYLKHRTPGKRQSVFTVKKISKQDGNRYRIDLMYNPSFIQYVFKVVNYDPEKPNLVWQNFGTFKGNRSGNHYGSKIRFLRSGFETIMSSGGRSTIEFVDTPKPGQIKQEDTFIVYTIQPGDKVLMPSIFSIEPGTKVGSANVFSTGKAKFRLKGGKWHDVAAGETEVNI